MGQIANKMVLELFFKMKNKIKEGKEKKRELKDKKNNLNKK